MKKIYCIVLALIAGLMVACQSVPPTASKPATKLVALTFDDGPDPVKTALVLDRLEKYHVVATFFMIGQKLNDDAVPVVKRLVKLGCEVGNHSWAWDSMNGMTPEQIKDSVSKTTTAIKKYTGKEPAFFRPPNLAVSEAMYQNVGLPFADGILGMDWDGCGTDAAQRAKNVLNSMDEGAIILLHDVQPDPHPTPDALDILIPELIKQGYEFVTVSELFKRQGVKPENNRMWKFVSPTS